MTVMNLKLPFYCIENKPFGIHTVIVDRPTMDAQSQLLLLYGSQSESRPPMTGAIMPRRYGAGTC